MRHESDNAACCNPISGCCSPEDTGGCCGGGTDTGCC